MKKWFVLIGMVVIVSTAGALYASGTIWSEVKDNVAYVYHDDAEFNCCPEMVITQDVDEQAKIIDIYEQDTLAACDCICNYDFTHKFDGLAPGQYTAKVWESGCKECEFTLAGTTTFIIVTKINPLLVFDTVSPCHEAPGVEERHESGVTDFKRSSLSPVEIAYTLTELTNVSISIFDVSGRKVRSLFTGEAEPGEHIMKWDQRNDRGEYLPKGIYLVTLATPHSVKSLPLIVLK